MTVETYTGTIDVVTRTLTVPELTEIAPSQILTVKNLTRGRIVYSSSDRLNLTSDGSTVTLPYGSVYLSDSSSDTIEVRYKWKNYDSEGPSGPRTVYQVNNELVSFELVQEEAP